MRVALVLALAAVAFREPDAPVGDTVDGADVDAVRANHFHVLGDPVRSHLVSPLVLPIALELGVLRQVQPRELSTRVRRPAVQTSLPCWVLSDFAGAARILGKRFMVHTP